MDPQSKPNLFDSRDLVSKNKMRKNQRRYPTSPSGYSCPIHTHVYMYLHTHGPTHIVLTQKKKMNYCKRHKSEF